MSPASVPMRILHVSHTSHRGGAELALARLLEAGPEWHASVCAPRGGSAFDTLTRRGVDVSYDLPPLPTGGTRSRNLALAVRYLTDIRACARVLRRSPLFQAADVVHANTAAAAIFCAMANRNGAKPLVIHLRDLATVASLGRFGFTAFTKIALPRADGVVANSRSTLRSAEALLPAATATAAIQSPIGIARRGGVPAVSEVVRRVGMLGRLQRWKGQHVFLEAFARAFRGTGVRADIAGAPLFGEEAYEHELRAMAANLGIADQVHFLGHVEDVSGFLDSVDILVHASTKPEPLGQTVMQGLACGKPTIATEGGGPSEWIQSGVNGLLVPPDRPEALASALRSLADSHELRAKVALAAAQTEGILTDEDCVTAHADFFRAVCQAHRAMGRS